jgi:hypothetical protein
LLIFFARATEDREAFFPGKVLPNRYFPNLFPVRRNYSDVRRIDPDLLDLPVVADCLKRLLRIEPAGAVGLLVVVAY